MKSHQSFFHYIVIVYVTNINEKEKTHANNL